ncbi:3-dehydroquinate synthase [Rubellimicrobium rubrum]|uniref:3-dehydroquinate synthase n=1 Tax=Rubellimicrobium rubrum TaxID=2585369 RepID=A0A5C4MY99_9RHOB|nr:3-dehydroquinate synthase [Rubellimicrobium rubrum]TNC51116.1 3-dehydroquinate synthase [Rubellimicrobium rubrum]
MSVRVDLPGRAYSIEIGPDLLDQAGRFLKPFLHRPRVSVVTDAHVAALHWPRLAAALEAEGISAGVLVLPPGEGTKGWEHLSQTVEWLLEQKVERRDLVVALSGGVIGDLTGFAAAILRRGVRFVQIPTTLLAQVDSSVGGKTGINTPQGKNLVGAFHQPTLVLADTTLLTTLSQRDFLSGYGEVVKYGLLGDRDFYEWLERSGPSILAKNGSALDRVVRRSCQMKAEIVMRDETEEGDRALLNLGHTFAHALEAATGYSDRLLHGEAVAIGLGLAFDLSARMGLCSQEEPSRIRAHLGAMGMMSALADVPGQLPGPADLLSLMGQDKKAVGGKLRFILARGIGQAFVAQDVPEDLVLATLRNG